MSDFYGPDRSPRARKPHRCWTCFRTIDPGEVYHAQTGRYDGRFYEFKQCAHCWAIWLIYRPEDGEGLISETGYDYWRLEGNFGSSHPYYITELRHRALFAKHWRRKDGTLYPVPETGRTAA